LSRHPLWCDFHQAGFHGNPGQAEKSPSPEDSIDPRLTSESPAQIGLRSRDLSPIPSVIALSRRCKTKAWTGSMSGNGAGVGISIYRWHRRATITALAI